jgi:hypothetical protein
MSYRHWKRFNLPTRLANRISVPRGAGPVLNLKCVRGLLLPTMNIRPELVDYVAVRILVIEILSLPRIVMKVVKFVLVLVAETPDHAPQLEQIKTTRTLPPRFSFW